MSQKTRNYCLGRHDVHWDEEGYMELPQPSSTNLLEEYKLCQQKATSLADSIWKTALLSFA